MLTYIEYLDKVNNPWGLAALIILLIANHFQPLDKKYKYIIIIILISLLIFIVFRNNSYDSFQDEEKDFTPSAAQNQQANNISGNTITVNGNFSIYNQLVINGTPDHKMLKDKVDISRKTFEKFPKDPRLKEQLIQDEDNLKNFERNILKLAEDITKMSLNSERGIKAKNYFEKGDFKSAREILNDNEMDQEQITLINKLEELNQKRIKILNPLNELAEEYLLKAKLTAVNFELKENRIPKTREYFEKALIPARKPEYLHEYAFFLQDNNLQRSAREIYIEILEIYQRLEKKLPLKYKPLVANAYHNIAALQAPSCQCRNETEEIYKNNLKTYKSLNENDSHEFLPSIAMTLYSMGMLIGADGDRHFEAEIYFLEALEIYKELAYQDPDNYLNFVAETLNSLGILIAESTNRRNEAESTLRESLRIYSELAESDWIKYSSGKGMTLNNIGYLLINEISRQEEVESAYQDSLKIYQELSKINPEKYSLSLASALEVNGNFYLKTNQNDIALSYFKKAKEIFAKLTQQPNEKFQFKVDALIFFDKLRKIDDIINKLEIIKTSK